MIKQNVLYGNNGAELLQRISANSLRFPRRSVIAAILLVALLAFELFNFDTTRYALSNLLGPVSFLGLGWASILAIAFCAIDFAGLVRLFTPESGSEQPKEVWYLMGAWLLGATMNALMTWWAVSLTLLNHDFGNEVLSRGQLLQVVPIFVATLVWLTRILFIGALTVTGSHLLFSTDEELQSKGANARLSKPTGYPLTERAARGSTGGLNGMQSTLVTRHGLPHVSDELPAFLNRRSEQRLDEDDGFEEAYISEAAASPTPRPLHEQREKLAEEATSRPAKRPTANGRVRQRPPMPGSNGFKASARRSD